MPRTATNRSFGFRSPGLVRILTAADADEVLTALEILGISPERPATLEQALGDVVNIGVEHVFRWVGALQTITSVVEHMDALVSAYSQEVDPSPAIEQLRASTNTTRALAIASMHRWEELRDEFTERMLAAKVQNPEVAWPPMPGIDPQL